MVSSVVIVEWLLDESLRGRASKWHVALCSTTTVYTYRVVKKD